MKDSEARATLGHPEQAAIGVPAGGAAEAPARNEGRRLFALAPAEAGLALSILIPAYNAERHLPLCLESMRADAWPGLEVLVWDDGSTDDTAAQLATLQAGWPGHLRALGGRTNAGVSAARNGLIQAARGEHLWFVDADDTLAPGALSRVRQLLAAQQPDVLNFDFSLQFETPVSARQERRGRHRSTFGGPAGVTLSDKSAVAEGLLATGQLHPWSRVIHRRAWNGAPTFPRGIRMCEDMATMPFAMLRGASFYHCPEPLLVYRQHGTSAFAKLDEEKITQMSQCSAWLGAGLREWPLSEAAREATTDYVLGVYRSVCRQTVKAGLPLGPHRQAFFRDQLLAALPPGLPAPGRQNAAPRSALAVWRAWAIQGKLAACLRWAPWLFWPSLTVWPDRLKARLRRTGRRSGPA
jgi:hypothetical protein